ncbi:MULTISPECIES: hypothetical protein [Streptomyces]|uniref:Uncharacterized protein n=1 Tax=Streptomyces arboris TaxID=2600619 RepID=A0A5N5EDW5_9ACTN|nr:MULTISPECIES: hypothetical protein [Streptomyces]KAB2588825.1 hypothetical protein F5983_30150 [Streptomyces arboris]MDX3379513.1 hypothetical protein [Streptomyces sp. ME02-6991-2A]
MGLEQAGAEPVGKHGDGASTSTRLNGIPEEDRAPHPQSPGSRPDLASTPAQKRAAANTISTELQPNTKKAGNRPDESMTTAISAFSGWATGKGLKTVHTTWESQVRTLLGRLDSEKGALGSAANIFLTTDTERGASIKSIPSSLNSF